MPIVGAFATSHAYTFQEPETWDTRRERSKANVSKKTGRPASDTAEARAETLEDNRRRYAPIRDAHGKIRERLAAASADAVLLIGDDQAENFTGDNMPQLLVYTGEDYIADDWDRKHTARIANEPEIARKLVAGAVEEGFDVSWSDRFKDDKLLSHAHTEPILYLVRDSGIPVIPLFVNAVHPPTPSAARCSSKAFAAAGESSRGCWWPGSAWPRPSSYPSCGRSFGCGAACSASTSTCCSPRTSGCWAWPPPAF